MIARPLPTDTSTGAPLKFSLPVQRALTLIFIVVLAGWGVYLFTFWDVAVARTHETVCALDASALEAAPFQTSCTTLALIAEVLAHITFVVSALILHLSKKDEVAAVLHAIMLILFSLGLSTVTIGLSYDPELNNLSRAVLHLSLLLSASAILFFPDGRLRPKWAWIVSVAHALWGLTWWLVPGWDMTRNLTFTGYVLFALATTPSLAIALYNYRRHFTKTQRNQTRWVLFGTVLGLMVYLLTTLPLAIFGGSVQGTLTEAVLLIMSIVGRWVAASMVPLSIVISIIRYRLWDIDVVISRAAAMGIATVILGGVFMALLLLVQRVANLLVVGDQSGVALAVASLAVAALFNPVRTWLRQRIDARFYPRHFRAEQVTTVGPRLPIPDEGEKPTESFDDTRSEATGSADQATVFRPDGVITGSFAGFEVTGLIGRGGMAEVYRARQTGLNRDVAIKVLTPGLSGDSTFQARFEREGRTLAGLSHPNIVKVFDAGERDGVFYIAMEYIDGESLATALARDGAVPLERALPILHGVASALDHAHLHGVIHRDVKPHNIMLQRVAEMERPVDGLITFTDKTPSQPPRAVRPILMDFGIARLLAAHTMLTAGAGALGTLDYIAPEQIMETSTVDARADIYSLGVVAYQMVTGRLPFREANAAAIIMSHLQKPAPDPRVFAPDLSGHAALAILRAMAKHPDERPQTATAFAASLGELPTWL